jgi:hypothetical protein
MRSTCVPNTIDVEIRDIQDVAVVTAITETIREGLRHMPGKWHVSVSASGERRRWSLDVRGDFGRHSAKFLAAPDHLPEGVGRRLLAFLATSAAPRS